MSQGVSGTSVAMSGLVITLGGVMVFSALTGTPITDVLAGKRADVLDAQGGSKEVTTDVSPDVLSGGTLGGPAVDAIMGKVGTTQLDGLPVANWIVPILRYARKNGWSGRVTSGYRSTAEQARICATGVKPCATPGTSNHQKTMFPGGAVDVTEAATLDRILRASSYRNLLQWAGTADPVHFSHPHGGSY